jgi:hypothetical protein
MSALTPPEGRTLVSVLTTTSSGVGASLTLTQATLGAWLLVRVADLDTLLEIDQDTAARLARGLGRVGTANQTQLIAFPIASVHFQRPENAFDGLEAAKQTGARFLGVFEQEQSETTQALLLFMVRSDLETQAVYAALQQITVHGGCEVLDPYPFDFMPTSH